MNLESIEQDVLKWAAARMILTHSDPKAQALKAVSELGEVADAVIKDDQDALVDGIGDVVVCLIILAKMQGTNLTECLSHAYNEIKDRKGAMTASGAFVKEVAHV